jgi:chromosome segregation ATPase
VAAWLVIEQLKLQELLRKRQPLATKVEEVENNLQSLSSALHGLDQHRSQLLSQADDVETRGRLQEINLTTIQSEINTELAALSKLKTRFSRKTLNIGVIGRAGQGKSSCFKACQGYLLTKFLLVIVPTVLESAALSTIILV